MFGKSRYLDYILAGSLSKTEKTYISRSILYSVREKKVITRFTSRSQSLFRLAEKEIREIFIHIPDQKRIRSGGSLDLVFLLDLSYRVNNDWETIKKAVTGLSSKLIDEYGISTRITIYPYADGTSFEKPALTVTSLFSLKKELNRLSPKGRPGKKDFVKSLARAVKNTRWRKGAGKHILIITNSDPGHSGFAEDHAFAASQRGIKIHGLTLGSIKGDENETVRRLSEITGGTCGHASYYSSIYKPDGEKVHLYFENGRLFRSSAYAEPWKNGISKGLSSSGSPYDEIFYDEKKIDVDPYTMDEQYTRITGNRTIKKNGTESNLKTLVNGIIAQAPGHSASARVLLSDGKISVWVPVEEKEKLRFFRKRHADKFTFPLGVSIRSAPDRVYGILLVPEITGISSDYIPDMLKTGLEKIIKKRDIYSGKGFLTPPIWFLELKVTEIRNMREARDIRDR